MQANSLRLLHRQRAATGGGKPDMAMAGAKNPEKIDEALAIVKETVYGMIKA